MEKFTYVSKYGKHEDCYFQTGHYENGNLAIMIFSDEEGPITKVTVNPDFKVELPRIAIKNYAENEGMAVWLKTEGLIAETPVFSVASGWVEIPIYTLTDKGKKAIGI